MGIAFLRYFFWFLAGWKVDENLLYYIISTQLYDKRKYLWPLY